MPVDNVNDVIQSALAYQRARLEAAAFNVANANVPVSATAATAPVATATPDGEFARRLGVAVPDSAVTAAEPSAAATVPGPADTPAHRLALEPGHPAADANGVVRYPEVDLAQEMTTMMSASRAYEASIRSFNLLKNMNAKAMEIGK